MNKLITRITIYQSFTDKEIADSAVKLKPRVFQIYSHKSLNINISWEDMEQKAKVVIPRRVKYIGALDYNFSDYDSLNPKTFPYNIQKEIFNITDDSILTNWVNTPMRKFITVEGGVNSLINIDSNINNGKYFNEKGYRTNPLIRIGDIIVIQVGYLMKTANGNTFQTIDGGNIGNTNEFSSKLPDDLKKASNINNFTDSTQEIGSFYNPDNRWKPYNRGYVFRGFVTNTSINNDADVEISCEDLMWFYNRAKLPNSKRIYDPNDVKVADPITGKKGWTVEMMILDMIENITNVNELPQSCIPATNNGIPSFEKGSISLEGNTSIKVGKVILTGKMGCTIGDVLKTLKNDYGCNPFFRPNTDILNFGPFVYNSFTNYADPDYTKDMSLNGNSIGQENFIFITGNWTEEGEKQALDYISKNSTISLLGPYFNNVKTGYLKNKQNIISTNLEFKRTESNFVGIIAKSIFKTDYTSNDDAAVETKDGRKRKKPKETSAHAGDYGGIQYTIPMLTSSGQAPDDLQKKLENFAKMKLNQMHYNGLYGSFTTYGYPYVNPCDRVTILDLSFPERNGTFYIRRVERISDESNGLLQTIHIDYKIPDTNEQKQ